MFLLVSLLYKALYEKGLWLWNCSSREYEETNMDDPSPPQKRIHSFKAVLVWLHIGSASTTLVHLYSALKSSAFCFGILCFSKQVLQLRCRGCVCEDKKSGSSMWGILTVSDIGPCQRSPNGLQELRRVNFHPWPANPVVLSPVVSHDAFLLCLPSLAPWAPSSGSVVNLFVPLHRYLISSVWTSHLRSWSSILM